MDKCSRGSSWTKTISWLDCLVAFDQLTQGYVMAWLYGCSSLLNWWAFCQQNVTGFSIVRMAEWLKHWTQILMRYYPRGFKALANTYFFWPIDLSHTFVQLTQDYVMACFPSCSSTIPPYISPPYISYTNENYFCKKGNYMADIYMLSFCFSAMRSFLFLY